MGRRFLILAAIPLLVLSFAAGYYLRQPVVKHSGAANGTQKKISEKVRAVPEKQEVKTVEPEAKPAPPPAPEPTVAYVPEAPPEKPKLPVPEAPETVPPSKLKRVCLILDDFGYNFTPEMKRVLDLNPNITPAILPSRPYSRKIMDYAVKSGHEVIIHAPLEGSDVYVEPRFIRHGASPEEINGLLTRWFNEIPSAVGINNHQGSIATADRGTMESIVEYLGKHEKLYVDSLTTPKSVGFRVAREKGLPTAKRTSPFLDNEDDQHHIRGYIEQWLAQAVGREKFIPIAIGHITKANTRRVLMDIVPRLEQMGYVLVPVTEAVSPSPRGRKPERESKDIALHPHPSTAEHHAPKS